MKRSVETRRAFKGDGRFFGILLAMILLNGCAGLWAGAGAATALTGYEAYNKKELNKIEQRHKQGTNSERDYGTQKDAIEDRSLVY